MYFKYTSLSLLSNTSSLQILYPHSCLFVFLLPYSPQLFLWTWLWNYIWGKFTMFHNPKKFSFSSAFHPLSSLLSLFLPSFIFSFVPSFFFHSSFLLFIFWFEVTVQEEHRAVISVLYKADAAYQILMISFQRTDIIISINVSQMSKFLAYHSVWTGLFYNTV